MLTIRLSKVGKKNKKMHRLIISEKTKDTVGDFLEILGSYNPHSKDLQAKTDRINYWISKGAQMSATVNNLLIEKKIITGAKAKTGKISNKRKLKLEKDKEAKAKAKVDAEAKASAKAEAEAQAAAAPVEVAPATETTEAVETKVE